MDEAPTPRNAQALVPVTTVSRWDAVAAYAIDLFFKFGNDCTMNLVNMVAFSVLTSFVPLILAVVLVLALLPGTAPHVPDLASQLGRVLPADVQHDANITGLTSSIHGASGALLLVTIIGLLWGGSNLLGSVESSFAFVYRVKTRDIVPQKLLALVMIVMFVVLLPLSFASTVLLAAATTTLGGVLPAWLNGTFSTVLGLLTGLSAQFLLFVAIYIIVPNMPIAWRHAWRGALVASVIMWFVNTAFPFYAAHFIGTREYGAATIGTVIITMTWVWFFSLVLLLGAQINALGLGIAPWKYDISRILMETEGPLLPMRHRRRPRGAHTPLPFSGLIRDSHKVVRVPPRDVLTISSMASEAPQPLDSPDQGDAPAASDAYGAGERHNAAANANGAGGAIQPTGPRNRKRKVSRKNATTAR